MRDAVHVRYVDDEEESAARAKSRLQAVDPSLSVETATDSGVGFEDTTDSIDCLVVNVALESPGGFEMFESVREGTGNLPCVLFSDCEDDAAIERALRMDGVEYQRKGQPAQFALLARRVHAAIALAPAGSSMPGSDDPESVAVDGSSTVTTKREPRHPEERIEEIASVVSHDLQNPLTIANGYLARARIDDTDEYFDHVEDALEEMRTISDDVVALARLGQPVRSTEPIELETLAASVWQEMGLPEGGLVTEELEPISGHRDRVLTLFERLFDNALRHGPSDVSVTVGATSDGFYIADDGPGVSPDQRTAVLEAGYSTVQQRPGLGLTIVRTIADAHGWELTLSESADGGLRVDVRGVERATAEDLETDVRL